MKKLKISIEGMHCASCASNVEKSVSKVSGVKSCSVSLMLKKGNIECEDKINIEDIKKAVAKTGYKVVKVE
ncbi:heavy-metal-associated domain-containing protein [Candidatus Pacearchaeota archaeon]|nr:heavy-metal-associated domain-containing protein [Candidatus Pacearchaeota archaeon]